MRHRKNIKSVGLILSLLLFSYHSVFAQVYAVENGKALFNATMPLNSYTGESEVLKGSINFETGEIDFSLQVKSIKTGITKRDDDMYELLNIGKYPAITFKGKLVKKYDPNVKDKQSLQVKGEFTLAGTTREVMIGVELKPEGTNFRLTSSWDLLITDYNIKQPKKFFLKVDDKHNLTIDALLVKK
ncbi:YceI family protein [Bizionia sp. M204]|uniref:YceI family protein n=1 Tax=Bizionia sp. M204 TaxID=2675331 RepID=UPI00204C48D2|nr:YceI family protein [Bizionia sp. M204]UPS91270.1 YceI family protein [Bizionia sp. M204]